MLQEVDWEPALDIHALAVITVYEATAYEPRFRHAELVEANVDEASSNNSTSIKLGTYEKKRAKEADAFLQAWGARSNVRRRFYLFKPSTRDRGDEPDTPGNMISLESRRYPHPTTTGLTDRQKEAIFYQTRMHVSEVAAARPWKQ